MTTTIEPEVIEDEYTGHGMDLTGERYGRLLVQRRVGRNKHGAWMWECLCDCGNISVVIAGSLRQGLTQSCGCLVRERAGKSSYLRHTPQREEMIGKVFGRLTVLRELEERNKRGRVMYFCGCSCGGEKIISGGDLRNRRMPSCGCYTKELCVEHFRTHGLSKHPLFAVRNGIKSRCNNKNNSEYHNYGARGITLCEEWNDFRVFYDWAINAGYKAGLILDRIDNDGNYCPENCRWVDAKKSAINRRTTIYITYNGESRTMAEWSDITGMSLSLIESRQMKGWSAEDIFSTPYKNKRKCIKEELYGKK
jgi:hypothetical protein